jgi:hypothetical protein
MSTSGNLSKAFFWLYKVTMKSQSHKVKTHLAGPPSTESHVTFAANKAKKGNESSQKIRSKVKKYKKSDDFADAAIGVVLESAY